MILDLISEEMYMRSVWRLEKGYIVYGMEYVYTEGRFWYRNVGRSWGRVALDGLLDRGLAILRNTGLYTWIEVPA